MKDLGAVFGQKFGWERPNFFATDGMEQKDDWSFRRSKWFEAIKKECQNVKENVGLLDMTAFAKCRIKGPGAPGPLILHLANAVISRRPTFSFTFWHSFLIASNHLDLLKDQSSFCSIPSVAKKLGRSHPNF